MRKVILVSALVLVVALATFATESGPSNTVGFLKYQYIAGPDTVGFVIGFTPFSLPFKYYQPGYIATTSMDTIIGTQAALSDEVWDQNTYQIATYYYTWYGAFPMQNTHAFWWNHPDYAAPPNEVDITTAGEVNTGLVNYGIVPAGFTAYGVPIAGPTLYSSMELDLTGMTWFEVWNQNTYTISTYYGGWYPDGTLNPGRAIWVKNNDGVASPLAWVYDPSDDPGRGTTIMQTPAFRTPTRTQTIERAVPSTPNRNVIPNKRTR